MNGETNFSWYRVWNNFAAVFDDYVNTSKAMNFLDGVGKNITEQIPLIKREFRYTEYVELMTKQLL